MRRWSETVIRITLPTASGGEGFLAATDQSATSAVFEKCPSCAPNSPPSLFFPPPYHLYRQRSRHTESTKITISTHPTQYRRNHASGNRWSVNSNWRALRAKRKNLVFATPSSLALSPPNTFNRLRRYYQLPLVCPNRQLEAYCTSTQVAAPWSSRLQESCGLPSPPFRQPIPLPDQSSNNRTPPHTSRSPTHDPTHLLSF